MDFTNTAAGTIGGLSDVDDAAPADADLFQFDSATGLWTPLTVAAVMNAYSPTRHACRMTLLSGVTTNTAGAAKKVPVDTTDFDRGGLADPTINNRIDIQRSGIYNVFAATDARTGIADNNYYQCSVMVNGSTVLNTGGRASVASGSTRLIASRVASTLDLTAGDEVELWFIAEQTDRGCRGNSPRTVFLAVSEV